MRKNSDVRDNLRRKLVIAPKQKEARWQEMMTTTCDRGSNSNGECVVWKFGTGKHEREKYVLLPEKLIHKQNSVTIFYHSLVSPFSVIYPAPFTVEGQTYSCSRQYIAHQQALLFGDEETARKIVNTTDRIKCQQYQQKDSVGKSGSNMKKKS